jgi:UDP:flavonoid glycosyltransferase YjiC (YdhE family)
MQPARSLRLVFAAFGSRGDVQPMVALAQAAAARGHHPLVAAPPNFETWVHSLGLEFKPIGIDVQQYLADNPRFFAAGTLATLREMRRLGEEQIAGQVQQLLAAVRGADGVVWAGAAFIAPSVAEHARLPSLGVAYTTALFRSDRHPPPMVAWTTAPRWLNRLLWSAYSLAAARIARPLQTARDALGLPRVPLVKHIREDQSYVIAADPIVVPDDPHWGTRYHRANFIHFDDQRELDPGLDEWLAAGEPPLFAGFGSMNGPGPRRAAQAFIDAFAQSGRRCLIGAGWAGLGDSQLPPGWRVVGDAPHAKLFPRVAVVIHHGGSGTMGAALRAGTPQVVLPLLMDQFLHGRLLHEAGLAPQPVPMEKIIAALLAERVDQALRVPAASRQTVAQRLQASDASKQIVDLAEAMCAATA